MTEIILLSSLIKEFRDRNTKTDSKKEKNGLCLFRTNCYENKDYVIRFLLYSVSNFLCTNE